MTAVFGPQNSNATVAIPLGVATRRYGTGVQTWVKDGSAPGKSDGTILDASFFNRIIGNLEYVITQSGVPAVPGDFTALYRAIVVAVSQGAPDLLNTIKELADAIGDDANFAITMSTALGNRVRFDTTRVLNNIERSQVQLNLGLADVAFSGNYSALVGKPTYGTAAFLDAGASANNVVQYAATNKLPGADGSALTNIPYSGLSGLPTLGSSAAQSVGVAAGNVVQLVAGAKLPAVDGSLLTGVVSTPPQLRSQYITATAPFVTPVGTTASTVFKYRELGGGASAGSTGASATNNSATGGGGGGEYVEGSFTDLAVGTSIAVTIGAGGASSSAGASGTDGGTTTIGAPVSVTALGGRTSTGVNSAAVITVGGAATGAGTGTAKMRVSGSPGQIASYQYTTGVLSGGGAGGGSPLGGGGQGLELVAGGNNTASGYGAGGGGASGQNSPGGAGTGGIVIIEWMQ